jgi:lipase
MLRFRSQIDGARRKVADVKLHLHEWGDADRPALVCLHGVTAHGRRFRRLAEERLARRFHVVAPDLRGHGRSDWKPPWRLETHVDDVLETLDALQIATATWLGHSFGGRLLLEAASREPARVMRAILLDPAIDLLPHVALQVAEDARRERVYASAEAAMGDRLAADPANPLEALEEEMREHLAEGSDGLLRPRYSQAAVVAAYGELAAPAPGPQHVPTLLVYSPSYGLVRDEHLSAYASALDDLLRVVPVGGGHMVYWDAYDATADAIQKFLEDSRA